MHINNTTFSTETANPLTPGATWCEPTADIQSNLYPFFVAAVATDMVRGIRFLGLFVHPSLRTYLTVSWTQYLRNSLREFLLTTKLQFGLEDEPIINRGSKVKVPVTLWISFGHNSCIQMQMITKYTS